jgi:hypothetical protein
MELWITRHGLEQLRHLSGSRRSHFGRLIPGRSRLVGFVLKDPRPPLSLRQSGTQNRMDTPHCANSHRLAIDPAVRAQVLEELVNEGGGEVAHQDVTQTGLEVAFHDGGEIANGGR